MKKIYLLILLFAFSQWVAGQNTWIQKLTYMSSMQGYWDTLTGVKHVETGADGSIYVLAHADQHNWQYIYKFYPNSNQLEWKIDVGYNGSMVDSWTDIFHVTADSGIVFCENEIGGPTKAGIIKKYDKNGVFDWTHYYSGYPSAIYPTLIDIIEKRSGGFYLLNPDSLFELDITGGMMDTLDIFGSKRIIEATNGDLLASNGSVLNRFDTSGNIIWTQPCSGPFDYDTSNVFIKHSASNIKKVDSYTGVQQWNIVSSFSPISEIRATHDGGCMASIGYEPTGAPYWPTAAVSPGHLFKVDSLGDTLWTRTYDIPRYGLYSFAIMPNGNIITGGCYLTYSSRGPSKDFSAFICMMNGDGSYPLGQTNYISSGDADNNHFQNFVDDALQTMLAFGHTGIPRDSSLDGHSEPGAITCEVTNIAIDWPTFSGGINDKYSDHTGDGVVDSIDISIFNYFCSDSIPLYYRITNPNHSLSVEHFNFVPVNDTILPGESPEYYLVIGSDTNPVDSIYGFAVSYFISEYGQNNVTLSDFYSTGLGTPGLDLFKIQGIGYVTNQFERQHTLLCRTDFQNAVNVNDTVGYIRFGGQFYTSDIDLIITDFKAILYDGTEIPFSVSAGSIFIDSSSVSVSENENWKVKVYPNPADRELKIKNEKFKIGTTVTVDIFNIVGEKVKTIPNLNSNESIPVAELPEGFYTGQITIDNAVKSFSFVIQH